VVLVKHQRVRSWRDHFLAACRALVVDDAEVDRLLIVDCHDSFEALKAKGVLNSFLEKR
jgi:hypothetical protein